jgi:hypothetical protein
MSGKGQQAITYKRPFFQAKLRREEAQASPQASDKGRGLPEGQLLGYYLAHILPA